MAALVKDKQFYDTLESTASTRFTDTGITHRQDSLLQKQKLAQSQSPENTSKHKQAIEDDEEFTQNFKEHYDIAEVNDFIHFQISQDALMKGKKISRDCKVEEIDLQYALNVLRIKTYQELNEIDFSLRPTIDKTWQRLQIQQSNFDAENADEKKQCKLLKCDLQELEIGIQNCIGRMKELEIKTGNWQMFKKKNEEQQETSPGQSPKKRLS